MKSGFAQENGSPAGYSLTSALLIPLFLFAVVFGGRAQGVDPLAPSAITPKKVQRAPSSKPARQRPGSPRNPDGDKPIAPDKPTLTIKSIVIVKSRAEIEDLSGMPSAVGLIIYYIPFLNQTDFRQMIQQEFIGHLLTENAIKDLEDAIILYCRDRGKPLVDVILPEQNIEHGVLQIWFLEGKVGKVTVNNPGHKWFKDQLILSEVRLKPSDSLDGTKLSQDINWLNNNPFRQVDVGLKPGAGLGQSDVELQVIDRFPVRPYIGYENSGTRVTGPDRLLAGVNWGNAFGLDHQFNYQYATDTDFDLVKAHSASYIAPLPWRHTLTLFGSYVDAKADFKTLGLKDTTAPGSSWQTSARYSIPMPQIQKYRNELSAGFDFKRSNNNLLAGGANVVQRSDTDIAQFVAGYTGLLPDRLGRTSVGLEAYYSPGGLTGDNESAAFSNLRTNASASYWYARFNAERITRLPGDFSWILRGWAQAATKRLLPSEELALGGHDTVRGYDERVVLGDTGWILNTEIRTPSLLLGNSFHVAGGRDELQFLGFFDYGGSRVVERRPEDGSKANYELCSTGVGFRVALSRNFSMRFDYGFALRDTAINERSSRAHIGALLSF